MSLEHFLAFVLAAEIVVIIPGPTVTLVVSQALATVNAALYNAVSDFPS